MIRVLSPVAVLVPALGPAVVGSRFPVVVVASEAAVVRIERPFEERGPRLVALDDRFDPPRLRSPVPHHVAGRLDHLRVESPDVPLVRVRLDERDDDRLDAGGELVAARALRDVGQPDAAVYDGERVDVDEPLPEAGLERR